MYNIIIFILILTIVSFLILLGAVLNQVYAAMRKSNLINKSNQFTYDEDLFK